MAFADGIRSSIASMDDIADLLDSIVTWATWAPTYSASGSMTFGTVTTTYARYITAGNLVIFMLSATGTTGGSASTQVRASLPVTAANASVPIYSIYVDGGSPLTGIGYLETTSLMGVNKADNTNWGTGSGRIIRCCGIYEKA